MPRRPLNSMVVVGVVGNGYLEVTDKLEECHFFLDMMGRTTEWPKFRWLTSAYLNAARATVDWLDYGAYCAIRKGDFASGSLVKISGWG